MSALPEVFFKYQSLAAGRAVLTARTLRWSTPATLNDPFDVQFDLDTAVDDDAVCKLALEKLWRGYTAKNSPPPGNIMGAALIILKMMAPGMARGEFDTQLEPGLREGLEKGKIQIPKTLAESRALMATSKILCLSETGDNPLMWAHYAESHRGISLMLAPIENSPYTLAKPIQYVSSVPALYDEEILSDILSGLSIINVATAMDKIVYSKSQEWSYEREWRVFAGHGRDKWANFEDCPFGNDELVGIVLGARMKPEDKTEFALLASKINPKVAVYQARLTSKFGVAIEKA